MVFDSEKIRTQSFRDEGVAAPLISPSIVKLVSAMSICWSVKLLLGQVVPSQLEGYVVTDLTTGTQTKLVPASDSW